MIAEDNPLPVGIKQNILALANFIFNHTFQMISDPAADLASACWSTINRDVAAGLRGR